MAASELDTFCSAITCAARRQRDGGTGRLAGHHAWLAPCSAMHPQEGRCRRLFSSNRTPASRRGGFIRGATRPSQCISPAGHRPPPRSRALPPSFAPPSIGTRPWSAGRCRAPPARGTGRPPSPAAPAMGAPAGRARSAGAQSPAPGREERRTRQSKLALGCAAGRRSGGGHALPVSGQCGAEATPGAHGVYCGVLAGCKPGQGHAQTVRATRASV